MVLWGLALTLGYGGLSFSFETVLIPAPIVVECAPSTSAFRVGDSVGFPSRFVGKLSSDHNDDVFRGSITRPASSLHPAPDPRSRGRLRVFTTDLLARLWSGGNWAIRPSPTE